MPERAVAYLVNQYPQVSHGFIRTEILALERAGWRVARFALRGWADELADPLDELERERTRYILQGGFVRLALAMCRLAIAHPLRFGRAGVLAIRCAGQSDRGILRHIAYLAEACLLEREVRRAGIGHIHAHFGSNSAEVAMLAAMLGGLSYSFTVHGPEEFDKPLMLHLREKIARASFVVAITSFCRSQLMRWAEPAHWPRIRIVHCAIADTFREENEPVVPNEGRLVCVGRICEQKGQLLLVEAVADLRRSGIAVELVLAGDGPMRGEVEAAIAAAGMADTVRITGWLGSAQVRDELRAAEALLLPSFAEGLPIVIMEAMALERLPLTTAIAGIPELVRDGREGIVFTAGDAAAIAKAVRRFLAIDAGERAAMQRAARHRVLARHDSDREAARLADLFEAALRGQQL